MFLSLAFFIAAAQSVPQTLPIAQRGLRCAGGGRAIGDAVGKTFILQELQIVSRDGERKVIGFIYSGADGQDYIDLTPASRTHTCVSCGTANSIRTRR
jgi:hypothetical protein